jgi:ABC-type transport system, involved in lipoprotein release, permease component
MMFQWKYADERSTPKGQVGWVVTKISNPDRATQIASEIDNKFANSPNETKTQTEQAFSASFASMLGNLNLLLGSVALAVVLTTLFVAGNTMAMSVRERTTEIAVMRTLGSRRRRSSCWCRRRAGRLDHRRRGGAALSRLIVNGEALGLTGGFIPAFGVNNMNVVTGPRPERADRPARRGHPGDDGIKAQDRRCVEACGVMGLISSYNLRSMTVRKGTAAMTAMGIAMVVAVFVMTMAIAQGFNGALVASGRTRTRSCCARARPPRRSAGCCSRSCR